MNHTSDQHPLVRGESRRRATGPYADWYLWRDPAGLDADGAPLPPNNWVSFFGGPGWTVGAAARPVLLPHVPRRAARAELAQPGRRGRPVGDGPRLARPRRRRLPARRLQRLPQAPRAAVQPEPPRARPRGTARSTSTTATSPTSPSSSAGSGRSSTSEPGRMSVGELFDGDPASGGELTRATATSSSTGSCSARRGRRDGLRGRDRRARERLFGPTRLADGRALEPRPVAPGVAPRRRRPASTTSTRSRGRRGPAPDAARNAVPVLRRGARACATSTIPRDGDRRPAGAPASGPDFAVVEPRPAAGRRCRGPPGRAPGSRPAGRGSGSAPDARPRNVAAQAADPGSVLSTVPAAARAARASTPALQVGHATSRSRPATDDVLAYARGRAGGSQSVVAVNFGRSGPPVRAAGRRRRPLAVARSGPHRDPPAHGLAGGATLDARGRTRRVILERRSELTGPRDRRLLR